MHKSITHKVVGYLVQHGLLLVFLHRDYPEAGLQVPAGTIERGEQPPAAMVREIQEETGLSNVRIASYLGNASYDMTNYRRAEIQERHFFLLECSDLVEERWSHSELHDGLQEPTVFDFFWVPLKDGSLKLEAGQGALLPAALSYLAQPRR